MLHAGVDPSDLPEELGALLDPMRPIPASVVFFPAPIDAGRSFALGVPFAGLSGVGALTLGYYVVRDLGRGEPMGEVIVGAAVAILLAAVALAILHGVLASLREHARLKEGRHRCGVFLTGDWLLARLGTAEGPGPAWGISKNLIARVGYRRVRCSAERRTWVLQAVAFYRGDEGRYHRHRCVRGAGRATRIEHRRSGGLRERRARVGRFSRSSGVRARCAPGVGGAPLRESARPGRATPPGARGGPRPSG